MTRVLVTGAAGFIGSRLAARLIAEGNDVVGLDDLSDGRPENLADAPEVDLVVGDLRDEDTTAKAARGCGVIFHQGAMRSVPRSMEFPGSTTDVNVRGTLNVLLAAQEEGAVVVSASSSSVYGDQDTFPLREDMSPRPQSPYAASKLAAEIYCQSWTRTFEVPTVSLRYFNVYGPGQDPANAYAAVIPLFIQACVRGESPVIHGDGEQARDFTYIDDAVDANLLAARSDGRTWGAVLNVGGGGNPTSVNRVLRLVAHELGAQPTPVHQPPRAGDVRYTQADVALAADLIGYRPKVGFEEGIRRTVAWFAEHETSDR